MRTLFSLRRKTQPFTSLQSSKATPRRKKRAMVAGALVFALTPPLALQFMLYRQDLAVARESFPPLPALESRDRVLVLAPHCDDETLGAGGTIAMARRRGLPVRIVFLTNGDGSRSTQIAVDARQLRRNSFQELAKLRQKETLRACRTLGVDEKDVVFLGYPDGGTRELWLNHWKRDDLYRSPYTGATHSPYANSRTPKAAYCGEQVLADVLGAMRDFRPTVVITTHPADTHSDHQTAYNFARAALEQARLQNAQSWAKDTRLLTFLVHHGVWPVPYGYHPQAKLAPPAALAKTGTAWMQEELDDKARHTKKRALECYPSQLAFTPNYLRSFLRRNELFGTLSPQSASQNTPNGVQNIDYEAHQHSAHPLAEDAARDGRLRDLFPAGDLQSVALLSNDEKHLTLRLQMAGTPTSRLRYRVLLHRIAAQSSQATSVEIFWRDNQWRARLNAPNGTRELTIRVIKRSFELKVPRPAGHSALLLSAESFLRASRLDAIPTTTLRLPSPT
jgi:LmbE family N-acetylglucosaminyl deacetylase